MYLLLSTQKIAQRATATPCYVYVHPSDISVITKSTASFVWENDEVVLLLIFIYTSSQIEKWSHWLLKLILISLACWEKFHYPVESFTAVIGHYYCFWGARWGHWIIFGRNYHWVIIISDDSPYEHICLQIMFFKLYESFSLQLNNLFKLWWSNLS